MTSLQSLPLFDIVKRNFKTEADSRLFVTEIDAMKSSSFKDEATELSTKKDLDLVNTELLKDIALINKETVQLKVELTKEIALVSSNLTKEIALVSSDLIKQIDASKIELIKWTFSFWVTLLLFLVGSFFLRK